MKENKYKIIELKESLECEYNDEQWFTSISCNKSQVEYLNQIIEDIYFLKDSNDIEIVNGSIIFVKKYH